MNGHDDLAAGSANDSIQLCHSQGRIAFNKGEIIGENASYFCLLGNILAGFGVARFELNSAWQVNGPNGVISLADMTVDGGMRNRQVVGVNCVVDMLAVPDSIGDDSFCFIETFPGQRDAFPRFNQ